MWTELLTNPEALSIYDVPPSLNSVELLGLRFSQGLSTLDVELSLEERPSKAPDRWPAEANAVAMTLQFSNISSSALSQSTALSVDASRVKCGFRRGSHGFLFDCDGEQLNLWAECEFVRVTHLAGYIRDTNKENQ